MEKQQSRECCEAALKEEDRMGQSRGDQGEHSRTWRALGSISPRAGHHECVSKGGESFWFIAHVLELECLDVNPIDSLGLIRVHLSESRLPLPPDRSYSYTHHGGSLRMNRKVSHTVPCLAHGGTSHSL